MEDRKKEWFGVTLAGSGWPVETVVWWWRQSCGSQSFRWRQLSRWRQSCGRQYPGVDSLEITALQSLYVPEKTREEWLVSLGSLEESVGRGSRFRRGIVGH